MKRKTARKGEAKDEGTNEDGEKEEEQDDGAADGDDGDSTSPAEVSD